MGKCIVCGKHGLFFKVNSFGRCEECERKEHERLAEEQRLEEEERQRQIVTEKQAAEDFFDKITEKLNGIKDEQDLMDTLGKNAIEKAENVEKIYDVINDYKTLIMQIKSQKKNPRFMNLLKSRVVPETDWIKPNSGTIPEWGQMVFPDLETKQYELDDVLSHVAEIFQKAIDAYEKIPKILEDYVLFEKRIFSLPEHEVSEDLQTEEVTPITLSSKVKLSQVTAKDFYQELGFFVAVAIDNESVGAVRYENWSAQDKVKFPLTPEGMTKLSVYIGEDNIVGADILDAMIVLNKIGASFLAKKRKYYDAVLLCSKMMESSAWQKDKGIIGVYNVNFESICSYFQIRDMKSPDQIISDCCAAADIFDKVCYYRAVS